MFASPYGTAGGWCGVPNFLEEIGQAERIGQIRRPQARASCLADGTAHVLKLRYGMCIAIDDKTAAEVTRLACLNVRKVES